MNTLIMALIALMSLAALCALLGMFLGTHLGKLNLNNVAWNAQLGPSEHDGGVLDLRADAQIAARYMLVKSGSDYRHMAIVAAASDEPLGVCVDAPFAQEDAAAVRLLNASKGTQTMIAGAAIGVGAEVYSDGTGKVGPVPTVAGTYWLVGHVVGQAAGVSGDYVEVEAIKPVKVIVLAEFTAVTTAAASDLPTAEALANAIKADLTALRTALNTRPALIKVL